ncbi:MAG: hypothetical protein H6Q72_1686 [Firmicutes bacterium]|nr:hypothetical protein [Bacillota bacterium]
MAYIVDDYTISLLHFEDGITDETGKTWTAYNGATVSTAKSKLGTSSLYLDGVNQYLRLPYDSSFDFSLSDFTVDFYIYLPSSQAIKVMASMNASNELDASDIQWGIFTNSSGSIQAEVCKGTTQYKSSACAVTIGEWHHVAIVKNGTNLLQFINGVLTSTTACSASINSETSFGITIGYYPYGSTYINCYIDEFRISNIARWTSDFNPDAPTDLTATAGDAQVTLSWTAVTGAMSYIVKRATTSGGTYTTIASGITDTSYVDTDVINGTTYYYVVTAVNDYGESDNSNEASATPQAAEKALLLIEMVDGLQKEYELTETEIETFLAWFIARDGGSGAPYYEINKDFNIKPFTGRTDYLVFDKIQNVEVMQYAITSTSSNVSTTAETTDTVLLAITMFNGECKEYELSETEVEAFITWYTTKDGGSGNPYYEFSKDYNIGPFTSRTDYLVFDKIQNFEVMEYNE